MEEILYYHGDNLRKALSETKEDRRILIEGFIPEKSITMIYADDGIGKSTINLQAMAEASSNLSVFEGLFAEEPLNVIYVLGERDIEEPFERLVMMDNKLHFNFQRFAITDKLQGFNLQNERHHEPCLILIKEIAEKCFSGKVDIVNFDPIYALCGGKLKEDEDVSTLRRFILKVKKMLNCSIIIIHHENRGTYDKKTKKRIGGDYYGNKFLSAMCTGVWHMKERDNGLGTILSNEKDSYKTLLKFIPLIFDEEYFTSKVDASHSSIHIRMILNGFMNQCLKTHKKFALNDLKSLTDGVCNSTFRKILNPHLLSGKIRNCKPLGEKALYEINEEVQ